MLNNSGREAILRRVGDKILIDPHRPGSICTVSLQRKRSDRIVRRGFDRLLFSSPAHCSIECAVRDVAKVNASQLMAYSRPLFDTPQATPSNSPAAASDLCDN